MVGIANRVVIVMSGGVITSVLTNDPHQTIVVHDWDEMKQAGKSQLEAQALSNAVSAGCEDRTVLTSLEVMPGDGGDHESSSQCQTLVAELRAPRLTGDALVGMRYTLTGKDFTFEQVGQIDNSSDIWDLHFNPGGPHEVTIELPSLSNDGWAELEACFGSFHEAVRAAMTCELHAIFKRRSGPLVTVCEPDPGVPFDVLMKLVKLDLDEVQKLFSNRMAMEQLALGLPAMHSHPGGFTVEVSECAIANLASLLGDRASSMESSLASLDASDWERFTTVAMKIRAAKQMT